MTFLVATVVIGGTAVSKEAGSPSQQFGIVSEPPAEGPAIRFDGGYMVPYTETIPGTDVSFEMVPVPGGEFLLGSPDDEPGRSDDEGPQVRIRVRPFWIGKHETTWAEYHVYMKMYDVFKAFQRVVNMLPDDLAGVDPADLKLVLDHAVTPDAAADEVDAITSPTPLYDPSYTYAVGDAPNLPAVTMTQFAAKQYTKWLSGVTGRRYRLPTEAEWEYAARAGTRTAYSFGDDPEQLDEYAWYAGNTDFELHPVGSKKPNPWGLYDMHGNAAEWTLDEFAEDHYASLGGAVVVAADAVNWPKLLYPRVIRGGGWYDEAEGLRSAVRYGSEEEDWKMSDPNLPLSPWWFTEEPAMNVGLRLIRPLEPMSEEMRKLAWDSDEDYLTLDIQDRLDEGRGAAGKADADLPSAVEAVEKITGGS